MKQKNNIQRRNFPAELMNELFASMPFENAFGLLAKMPNGLLARNVQKMIIGIKEEIKNNKMNKEDCGFKWSISEDGLEAKYSGPNGDNCIRTILPIPLFNLKSIIKPIIVFHFEVQIIDIWNNYWVYPICTGFCHKQFPSEGKRLGLRNNSIGIFTKRGISIDGSFKEFGNKNADVFFKKGDFVGLGIIKHPNSKIECFVTWNDKFLGKAELPAKYANIQLFPAINLFHVGDSFLVNLGKDKWQFKDFKSILG